MKNQSALVPAQPLYLMLNGILEYKVYSSTDLRAVLIAVATNNTCGTLDHSRRRTTTDPVKQYALSSTTACQKTQLSSILKLTSLSEVPQTEQHLHSMHCHRYFFTEIIILSVNCRHDGWPEQDEKANNVEVVHRYACRLNIKRLEIPTRSTTIWARY